MSERKSHAKRLLSCGLGAVVVGLVALPQAAEAQVEDLAEKLEIIQPEVLLAHRSHAELPACFEAPRRVAPAVKDLWKLLDRILEDEEDQHQLKGSASLGYTGNEVEEAPLIDAEEPGATVTTQASDQYKVNLSLSLDRGFYPGRFHFESSVDLRVQDGDFSEDVSKLRLEYDYYTHPQWQIYAFGSRYSDSFLNIDQRYEAGAGVVFDRHFGKYSAVAKKDRQNAREEIVKEHNGLFAESKSPVKIPGETSRARTQGKGKKSEELVKPWRHGSEEEIWSEGDEPSWLACLKAAEKDKKTANSLAPKLKEIGEQLHEAWVQVEEVEHKESARWRVSLLVGALAEFEQATLTRTTSTPAAPPLEGTTTESDSFVLPSEQVTRLTLRPSLKFRPSPRWEYRAHVYYKPALANAERVRVAADGAKTREKVADERIDYEISAEFKVADAVLGQPGDISLVLRWENYHDTAPPTRLMLDDGKLGFSAPDNHRIVTLTFKIDWS